MANASTHALSRAETLDLIDRLDKHAAGLIRSFHTSIEGIVDLPPRLARLCNLGAAAAVRTPGLTREFMIAANDAGATREEIVEVLFMLTNFAGFAAMSQGVVLYFEVFGDAPFAGQDPESYPAGPSVEGYDQPGMEVGVAMYGPIRARRNIDMFRGVGGPAFGDALEAYAYSGMFRRRVLSHLEREIISVALLSCIDRPAPFAWHIKAALRLGATPEQLRHALIGQSTVSGVLTAFRGIAVLNPIVDDWRAHPAAD
jgi:alkylhydroperoxidase/carboxymuconolactone decarboxylase family protein YurZ